MFVNALKWHTSDAYHNDYNNCLVLTSISDFASSSLSEAHEVINNSIVTLTLQSLFGKLVPLLTRAGNRSKLREVCDRYIHNRRWCYVDVDASASPVMLGPKLVSHTQGRQSYQYDNARILPKFGNLVKRINH